MGPTSQSKTIGITAIKARIASAPISFPLIVDCIGWLAAGWSYLTKL
jgi:hypothetical protein